VTEFVTSSFAVFEAATI